MRKLQLILLLFIWSTQIIAQESLRLSYYKGNQITGKYLKIYENGDVLHGERKCCPPKIDWSLKKTLSKFEKNKLLEFAKDIANSNVREDIHEGSFGETYYDVSIFYKEKQFIVKRSRQNVLMISESESTDDIISFSESLFEQNL